MLFKKAYRAIWENKKAYIACVVLISIGIMFYVTMSVSSEALIISSTDYYKEYNLADVFSKVRGIPSSSVDSLENIEGVDDVLGRQVYDSRVMMEESNDIISLRLISDDENSETSLNNYIIVDGQPMTSPDDILVAQSFMEAWGLKFGEQLKLIIDNKEYDFTICGAVQSPEYVYAIKDMNQFLPDVAKFNIAYLKEETLANNTGMQGIYNDISFSLKEGFVFDDVEVSIAESLSDFGLKELFEKEDQLSYAMLDSEIGELSAFSKVVPAIFVSMSIIILYLMLKRVIEQDRIQIGTLKAFGYSNRQILLHYMVYGGITGFFGGLLGIALAFPMTAYFMEVYNQFYEMPNLVVRNTFLYATNGTLISICGGLVGAFMGAYNILKLTPSESMRPVTPAPIKNDFIMKVPLIAKMLTSRGSMAIRSIERNKIRSLFIVLGITFSFALMAFMASFSDLIDTLLIEQFEKIEVYDMKVTLNSPRDYDEIVYSVKRMEGVDNVEGLLEVPGAIKHEHKKEGNIILGIPQDAMLYKIYDSENKKWVKPPEEGVILKETLAKKLEVKKGGTIYIETPMMEEDLEFVVMDIIEQNSGLGCYIDKATLENALGTKDMATDVLLDLNSDSEVRAYLSEGKNVSSIDDKEDIFENMKKSMSSYKSMFAIFQVMGIVVAFAIIYNTSTISLSERKREYATLRVLGLQVKEVSEILAFEYWILLFFGVIGGIAFTRLLKIGMNKAIDIEAFVIPLSTPTKCFILALINCILAVFISNILASRNIKKFDMVGVLKERE